MQAIRYHPPSGPSKLIHTITEPIPTLQPNSALIKVSAVGVIHTELYWPIYQNADGTYKTHIPGHDFSGTIVNIKHHEHTTDPDNTNTSNIDLDQAIGTEVYAFTSRRNHEGALAEYVLADLDQIVPKPCNMSPVEAASVPLSALTAWQALFDHGKLISGQKLLITGVGGGTGVFAMQFAKRCVDGVHITGTGSSARSQELFKDFGGDAFVNYKETDLKSVDGAGTFDLVLDCVGGQVTQDCFKVVKKEGLVTSICTWDSAEQAKKHGVTGLFFIVSMEKKQLEAITALIEGGKVRTVVDRVFALEKTREAFEYASGGHVNGKVVVKVGQVDEH